MDSTTATEIRNTIRVYRSVNSSVQSQLATREGSDKFFKRRLDRDPRYGWRWTKWTETSTRPYYEPGELGVSEPYGWQELDRTPRVRLPR